MAEVAAFRSQQRRVRAHRHFIRRCSNLQRNVDSERLRNEYRNSLQGESREALSRIRQTLKQIFQSRLTEQRRSFLDEIWKIMEGSSYYSYQPYARVDLNCTVYLNF